MMENVNLNKLEHSLSSSISLFPRPSDTSTGGMKEEEEEEEEEKRSMMQRGKNEEDTDGKGRSNTQ